MIDHILKPCPFCGANSEMHIVESYLMYAESKKDLPKDARIVRETRYPNGKAYIEYRAREYIPRCSDTSCCGRATKRYKTDLLARKAWNTRRFEAREAQEQEEE